MKFLMVFLFAFSSSLFSQELTKIEADYRCELEGGGIAVKLGSVDTAKIWQTDMGEDEGLELDVTSFSVARCPGCFSFTAILMGELEVRGKASSSILTYEVFDSESNMWVPLLENVKCNYSKN